MFLQEKKDLTLISFHRMMLKDSERMQAYRQAILQTVRPGDVVLDIGTGSGIMAMFACQAGARRVYAVEREDIISVARQMAEANGFIDRIIFLHQEVKEVQLDEPVDVIVSELIPNAVLGENMAELVGWCRDRFLKPGGKIIPQEVNLCIAPVQDEALYERARLPGPGVYAIDFAPLEQRSFNSPMLVRIPAGAILAPEQVAYCYEAFRAGHSDQFEATLAFDVQRAGTLHGFGGWFAATLATGIGLSNRPPGTYHYSNLFFPLAQPVPVEAGAGIVLEMQGRSDSKVPFIWIWKTTVRAGGGVVAYPRQSSFLGEVPSPGIPGSLKGGITMSIEPGAIITRNKDLLSQPIDQELVILNLMRDNYAGLDEVGRRVWELLETPRRVDELCQQLGREFDAAPEQIKADVLPFLVELEHEGLVDVAGRNH